MSRPDADIDDAPRPLSAKDRHVIAWTIAVIIVGGYVIWQLLGIWTAKDAEPPAWLISPPAGATFVGEPRIDRQPYRATTYMTVRPAEGEKAHQLVERMGLSEQPTQFGPTPLDWRPVWVYSRQVPDGVELRLVYLRDSADIITPDRGDDARGVSAPADRGARRTADMAADARTEPRRRRAADRRRPPRPLRRYRQD